MTKKGNVDVCMAVTAVADVLAIDLVWDREKNTMVGHEIRQMMVFGHAAMMGIDIVDSKVDPDRMMAMALAQIAGSLFLLVIADMDNQSVTVFVLDGGVLKSADMMKVFPRFWSREQLYKNIASAVRMVYSKGLYSKDWTLIDKGQKFMADYFKRKTRERITVAGHAAAER